MIKLCYDKTTVYEYHFLENRRRVEELFYAKVIFVRKMAGAVLY